MTRHQQRAFTLIESLIVLALLSVLILLAAPSFRDLYRSSQLSSQTNTLIAALHAAKNEAIKHNAYSYLVPSDGSNWNSGWMVFVDSDFNQAFSTNDIKVLEEEAVADHLTITGTNTANLSPPYISFNGSGYPRAKNNNPANLTLSVKLNGLSNEQQVRNTRHIKLAITGRIRTCTPSSGSDANCNTSSSE